MISVKKIILITFSIIASLLLKAQIPCDTNFAATFSKTEIEDWQKNRNKGYPYSSNFKTDTIGKYLYVYFHLGSNNASYYSPNGRKSFTHRISYNCENRTLTFYCLAARQVDLNVISKGDGHGGVVGIEKINLEKTPIDTIVAVYREWFFAEGCSSGKASFNLTYANTKELIPCKSSKDWLLEGVYHKSQNNQDIVTGEYRNGYKVGKWFEYDHNGLVKKLTMHNNYGEILDEIKQDDPDWPY